MCISRRTERPKPNVKIRNSKVQNWIFLYKKTLIMTFSLPYSIPTTYAIYTYLYLAG